jgi:hypothetical protein
MRIEYLVSPRELLGMEKDGGFGVKTRVPHKSCSFDWAYVSSYLFVRGYVAALAKRSGSDRIAATQKFLETVRAAACEYGNEWLMYELADAIGMDSGELLETKNLQLAARKEIAEIDLRRAMAALDRREH